MNLEHEHLLERYLAIHDESQIAIIQAMNNEKAALQDLLNALSNYKTHKKIKGITKSDMWVNLAAKTFGFKL